MLVDFCRRVDGEDKLQCYSTLHDLREKHAALEAALKGDDAESAKKVRRIVCATMLRAPSRRTPRCARPAATAAGDQALAWHACVTAQSICTCLQRRHKYTHDMRSCHAWIQNHARLACAARTPSGRLTSNCPHIHRPIVRNNNKTPAGHARRPRRSSSRWTPWRAISRRLAARAKWWQAS